MVMAIKEKLWLWRCKVVQHSIITCMLTPPSNSHRYNLDNKKIVATVFDRGNVVATYFFDHMFLDGIYLFNLLDLQMDCILKLKLVTVIMGERPWSSLYTKYYRT